VADSRSVERASNVAEPRGIGTDRGVSAQHSHAYTPEEIRAAASRVCHPRDVPHLLRQLEANRIDARQREALARMNSVTDALAGATGREWLALQDDFTKAMAEAERDADRLYEEQHGEMTAHKGERSE
jgi:hypothetical protein